MRWFFWFLAVSLGVSLGTASAFAQSTETYNVVEPLSGKSYPVNYNITGATITDMSLDTNQTSLVISMQTTGGGNLTITLPRTLIDAKAGTNDDQFIVLEDGADSDFKETKTNTDRTLTIPIIDGTQKIEIIGTQVVPEFGPMVSLILIVSIIVSIMVSIMAFWKNKNKF